MSQTQTARALVVDDEVDLCRLMQITLTKMGIKSDIAYDIATAKGFLADNRYDFCLTDLRLPDGSGLELVRLINSLSCHTPVAVITAHGSTDLAIEALKLGAFDFVSKPLELPRLRQLVEHALRVSDACNAEDNKEQTSKSQTQRLMDDRLIGDSSPMQSLKSTITKLARSQAPVFLWGESGTGKEVVARLIHDLSPRRDGSFVPVNCGAIPAELMESEFFGHKKGSFTGATADKIGLFQQADGGTLFLDEVADLPLAMQVKLLRAIQEKTVRAVGDTKEVPVDIRLLSATHKDLHALVQQGSFRQDLFYRINVIELKLPTLNERSEDIAILAQHFLQKIAQDWQLDTTPTLSANAIEMLKRHHYKGNVRELRNMLERAITLTDGDYIDASHLNHNVDGGGESSQHTGFTQAHETSHSTHTPALQDGNSSRTQSSALQSNHVNHSSAHSSHPPTHIEQNIQASNAIPSIEHRDRLIDSGYYDNEHYREEKAHQTPSAPQNIVNGQRSLPTTSIDTGIAHHRTEVDRYVSQREPDYHNHHGHHSDLAHQTPNAQNLPYPDFNSNVTPANANNIQGMDGVSQQFKGSVSNASDTTSTNLLSATGVGASERSTSIAPRVAYTTNTQYPSTITIKPATTQGLPQSLPDMSIDDYLEAHERQLILLALAKTQGNKTKAADLLGTTFRSLRYRMKKLAIDNLDDDD